MIHNDNGVKLYVELKKSNPEFVMYSLCITMTYKSTRELMYDGEKEVVVCVEGVEKDAFALVVVESKNEYSLYISDFEIGNSITNCKNMVVKEK